MKQKVFLLHLIFLTTAFLFTEDIEFQKLQVITITTESITPQTLELNNNEAVAICLDADEPFLQGIEIKIKPNNDSFDFENTVNFEIFKTINQKPKDEVLNYTVNKIDEITLPNKKPLVLQIPTCENNYLEKSAFAKLLPYVTTDNDNSLIFKLSDNNDQSSSELAYSVKIRPLLKDEGGLSVNLIHPEEEKKVAITLNGRYAEIPSSPKFLILPVGDYQLIFNSDFYKSEMRTCKVDQNKITELNVKMCSVIPILNLNIPKEAQVFLDNDKIDSPNLPVQMTTGEHTIKVIFANYETIRKIIAEEGKTYTLNINIDVEIKITD